jgi:hypothetical protein
MQQTKRLLAAAALGLILFAARAGAGTITLGGTINQSTQDTGTPATANTSLNGIVDGDAFQITLTFTDPITSSGTFPLTGVAFSDPTAAASESGFISGTMVIGPSGIYSQFSVLGCLIDTSTCLLGNQLALNFQIATASFFQSGVPVQPIPALLPVDLLEDGGSTDIQGTLSTYSYSGPAGTTTPEPSSGMLTLLGFAGWLTAKKRRK